MDVLDQKLLELETEVWGLLPSLNDPRLKKLLADIASIRRTKELVGGLNGTGTGESAAFAALAADVMPAGYPNRNGLTRGDAIVEILRKSSGGMHVKHIVEELKAYNFEVQAHSAVGIMRRDTAKRFKGLGHSFYDLADDYRSQLNGKGNGNGYTPRPAFRRIKGLNGMTLKEAALQAIEDLEGEFSSPDVYALLIKRFPESASDILKESVTVTLTNLRKAGKIDGTYEGHGRYPKLFVKCATEEKAEI